MKDGQGSVGGLQADIEAAQRIKEKKNWLLYCTICGAAVADSIGRCAASEIATLSALAKQP
jgi:hypothetical protein